MKLELEESGSKMKVEEKDISHPRGQRKILSSVRSSVKLRLYAQCNDLKKESKSWSFTQKGFEAKRCYNDVCTSGQRTKSAPDFKRSQKELTIISQKWKTTSCQKRVCCYIGNIFSILIWIVNTLITDHLQAIVDKAMDERKEKHTKKKNITMRILSEFKRMFDNTKEISSKIYAIIN